MNADERRLEINSICEKIIGAAFQLANTLGSGFLEKVYENALSHELKLHGLTVEQQWPITVYYKEIVAGEYIADILVNSQVMIEIKAQKNLDLNSTQAQCLNYLKATKKQVCLLINFGSARVEIKRIVLDF